ncbi:hypothetical protein [Leptospira alstonii]|uniref:hypothetical protein n=1 Tax=Leptospira alstonii TaxID=28452 RepID=UPI00077383A2|nr:hypothetical protein [Leptospira alstonii]
MKYKTLVENWDKSRRDWFDFQDRMSIVAGHIYFGLKKNFEIEDEEKFKLLPAKIEDADEIKKTRWTSIGAIELIEGGWVSFAILITLEKSENIFPKGKYKIVIYFKDTTGGYLIKITESGPEVKISEEINSVDIAKVEESIDTLLINHINNSLENWKRG